MFINMYGINIMHKSKKNIGFNEIMRLNLYSAAMYVFSPMEMRQIL